MIPILFEARINLGDLLLSEKRYAEAEVEYRKTIEYKPDEPKLHFSLGRVLALQNKIDEARANFEIAVHQNPEYTDAHYELAIALGLQHKIPEAVAEYRVAIKLQPGFADALNNLAWILAANPDPRLRNGPEAVAMAEAACALTHNTQALKIGTLAAAYAEAGRFKDAVASAQLAHNVALAQGQTNVAAANLQLLKIYKVHQAYHEPPPSQ